VKKATHPPHDKSQLFHHYSIFWETASFFPAFVRKVA
jgi:hypothetical protein